MSYEKMEVPEGISRSEWIGLQQQFVAEGVERGRELLAGLDKRFDVVQIAHQMHQWAGCACQLGFHHVTESARRTEQLLRDVPIRRSEVRERITDLLLTFYDLSDDLLVSQPDPVTLALLRKSVA